MKIRAQVDLYIALGKLFQNRNCKIQKLKVQKTPLSRDQIQLLKDGVSQAKFLKFLSLDFCGVDDASAHYIGQSIDSCTTITQLSIQGNKLTTQGFLAIQDKVVQHQNITSFLYRKNLIEDDSM